FFFFQAEDGIRDFHVTGVQTCALPILDAADRLQRLGRLHPDSDPGEYLDAVKQWAIWSGLEEFDLARYERELLELTRRNQLESRSEERRVGKEGRAGGAGE